jgi:hypothetical protein
MGRESRGISEGVTELGIGYQWMKLSAVTRYLRAVIRHPLVDGVGGEG